LSFIRDLEGQAFDYLIVVLFNEDMSLHGMWKLPHGIIAKYARWSAHANAHILVASPRVLADPAVEQLA
jgi:hypothetical protein